MLDKTAVDISRSIQGRAGDAQFTVKTKLFTSPTLRLEEQILSGSRMSATAVGPQSSKVVLRGRSLLEKQPAVGPEQEDGERAMQLPRRLVGCQLLGDAHLAIMVIDEHHHVGRGRHGEVVWRHVGAGPALSA